MARIRAPCVNLKHRRDQRVTVVMRGMHSPCSVLVDAQESLAEHELTAVGHTMQLVLTLDEREELFLDCSLEDLGQRIVNVLAVQDPHDLEGWCAVHAVGVTIQKSKDGGFLNECSCLGHHLVRDHPFSPHQARALIIGRACRAPYFGYAR